ncbi:exopolysaccharide biosynthesis protein [Tropicimonas sp. IMCC6043]|uniref:exopolysaccharide biosynthesis protein n=1 Tax=Tropicimonas sp. IMCC6043 TaxID=2510645 RepID=UPI00101C36D2|nr:exopolysaccharide biosynthesis protein [Tropicimonas sp. IMCC6043]RYH12337.1 exopolysaccharide biosynthesis protein [Tropicimonas sp. IMCC6043]
MPTSQDDPPLTEMLRALTETIGTRERVFLGELIDALGARGYGPVILLAAAMTLLPTGMIPGVPAFMGVILMLTGVEMLRGRRGLWLPPRLYGITLPGPALLRGIHRAEPTVRRLERHIRARLQFLITWRISLWSIAAILIVTSGVMIVIGAIPGLPFVLALHLLAFGLGLTAGDGLFVVAGYAIFVPAAALAAYLAGIL